MAGEPDASAETQAVAPVQDKPDAAPAETQAVAPVYGKEEGTDFVTLKHEGITWCPMQRYVHASLTCDGQVPQRRS